MAGAPLDWVVRGLAWLPEALRPGLFLSVLLVAGWFVFTKGGLFVVWHALNRGVARVADAFIALALLPEYVSTSARRRQGGVPGPRTLAAGEVAEQLLDRAAAHHERHQRAPVAWAQVPWRSSVALVLASAAAWIVMGQTAPESETTRQLSLLFDRWRDVEEWADVDPSRQAAPGPASRDLVTVPDVRRTRRRGRTLRVTLGCTSEHPCFGTVRVRSASGAEVATKYVRVAAARTKTVVVSLPRGSRKMRVSLIEA